MALKFFPVFFVVLLVLSPVFARELTEKPEKDQTQMDGFQDVKQYGYGYGPRPGYGYGPRPGYGYGPRPGYGYGPRPGYGGGYGCRYRCGFRCCAAEEYAEYMLAQTEPQN